MKYTTETSAKITLILSYVFCVLLAALMIFIYPMMKLIFYDWVNSEKFSLIVSVCFYICCVPAWTALVSIIKIMGNVLKDNVFTHETVLLIRILAWCCGAVSLVCLVGGIFFSPLWIFTLGAAFLTLILRVLKSVMARATEIKDENELTI